MHRRVRAYACGNMKSGWLLLSCWKAESDAELRIASARVGHPKPKWKTQGRILGELRTASTKGCLLACAILKKGDGQFKAGAGGQISAETTACWR